MPHFFNVQCESEFCLFVEEKISAKIPKEAELIASVIHGETRRSQFKDNAVGCCPAADLKAYHDFPCPTCLSGEEDDDDDDNY